jgi:Na+/H+-dicarboxylate symporter
MPEFFRFARLSDSILKRWRIQLALIGVVWAIVAVMRTLGPDQSTGTVLITTLLWIVVVLFFSFAILAHIELRRRKSESLR